MKQSKQKISVIVFTITLILGITIFFFTSTLKGRSLSLYAVGGWGAPLTTRLSCASKTNERVDEKFLQPLNFDKKSKNAIKEFWYFSYYKECLFEEGYRFNGEAVPSSSLVDAIYINNFAGIKFTIPKNATLTQNNVLDVEFDSRLYRSEITSEESSIFIHTYLEHEDFKTETDLSNNLEHFSTTEGSILEKETIISAENVNLIKINQDDGMNGIAFITSEGHVVHIFGEHIPEQDLETIINTLTLF